MCFDLFVVNADLYPKTPFQAHFCVILELRVLRVDTNCCFYQLEIKFIVQLPTLGCETSLVD